MKISTKYAIGFEVLGFIMLWIIVPLAFFIGWMFVGDGPSTIFGTFISTIIMIGLPAAFLIFVVKLGYKIGMDKEMKNAKNIMLEKNKCE